MTAENSTLINYCPRCSAPAYLRDARKIICSDTKKCGFGLYLNTAAAVAALIFDPERRLLLVRRNRDPQKGLLDLPGGFVDFNEDGESALKRELIEELNIEIEHAEYYRSIPNTYAYGGVLYHTLDIFFTCRAKTLPPASAQMQPNDELAEILYKFPKDISEDELAFESMKKLISAMRKN
ncbi:MAG: NUDIX domain-containing protein [Chitinispirillales bacterium]|jgi:ADP-ribose pyrophosphatase YjhB (NUDIX family)|nr:NUDIX domain-containing protein [Chitinispirillales bacterium]